jgi:FecR protein
MKNASSLTWVRVWSLAMLAVIGMISIAPAAHAQSTVGTITQLTGAANIQRAGATIAATPNMPVMLHDRIATEPNASLTIGLVDNSSLQLGSASTLVIDDSVLVNGVGAPSKVGLLQGDLHSLIVGAMKGSSTTFEVNTPNAIGAVRGTDFSMHTDTNGRQGYPDCFQFTDLAVDNGTVQFCNTATPPECKDIKAGEHSTMACGGFAGASGAAGAAGAGGLGVVGGTVVGAGLAAGIGVGIAAGAGAFGGSGSEPKKPKSKKK